MYFYGSRGKNYSHHFVLQLCNQQQNGLQFLQYYKTNEELSIYTSIIRQKR